ncbi:MAG: VanZ family protein [Phycisphaerae bacterium]|nr:VanZ family protein [Phycisphaerae bacterium]
MTRPASAWIRRSAAVLCAVVWLAAATATHIPADAYAQITLGDVTLHFLGYLGLSGVFLLTLRLHGAGWKKRALTAIPVLLIYAVLDEITQPLVGRCAAVSDIVANAVGVFAAVGLDGAVLLLRGLGKHFRSLLSHHKLNSSSWIQF